MEFQDTISKRFPWGEIDIHFIVNNGIVSQCKVYSDAMEVRLIEKLPVYMVDCTYSGKAVSSSLESLKDNKDQAIVSMIEDIQNLLEKGM